MMMMMSWCLMSSDVSWHIRDKLWPMPKHGSIILYVHGNRAEGSLGRTAQDVHLDSHTAPELCGALNWDEHYVGPNLQFLFSHKVCEHLFCFWLHDWRFAGPDKAMAATADLAQTPAITDTSSSFVLRWFCTESTRKLNRSIIYAKQQQQKLN